MHLILLLPTESPVVVYLYFVFCMSSVEAKWRITVMQGLVSNDTTIILTYALCLCPPPRRSNSRSGEGKISV